MTTQLFGQLLAGLSYAGRTPTKQEYLDGSPAQKRAIIARWEQIEQTPIQKDSDWDEWTKAKGRLGWAHDLERGRRVREVETISSRETGYGEPYGGITKDDEGL